MTSASLAWRDAMADTSELPALRAERLSGATKPPHVCFVAPNIWPAFSGSEDTELVGGAEVQQSILARALARNGYPVTIICSDYGQPARVEQDGITLIRTFKNNSGIPVLRFIHPRLTTVWRAMHEVNADIYYQRTAAMLTAVVAAYCRRHGKRSIYAGASDLDFIPGRQSIRFGRDRWLFERGLARVDAIVVQSLNQQELCARHYDRSSTMIPSCYELPAKRDRNRLDGEDQGDYVLWVAAIRRGKRPEVLFEMARRLPQRRFVMIGGPASPALADREYFDSVRSEAAQLPNIEFIGFLPLPKAEHYFDRARLVVNTSEAHNEGMPNVFLQAWARGVPTVAFFDAEARLHGEPVYPIAEDIDAATAAVERMYSDDLHRARTSSRCLEYFSRTHATDAVLSQYRRLLDSLYRKRMP